MTVLRAVRAASFVAILAIVAVQLCCTSIARADRTWNPMGPDDDWLNGDNWTPTGVPSGSDNVALSVDGNYTAVLSGAAALVRSLSVGATSGTQTLRLENNASLFTADPNTIGANGELVIDSSSFNQKGIDNAGRIELVSGQIAELLSNSGTVEVTAGSNTITNWDDNAGTLRLADDGVGTMLSIGTPAFQPNFTNNGTIELICPSPVTPAGTTLVIPDTFFNNGTVSAQSVSGATGLLHTIDANVDNSGQFEVETNISVTGQLANQSTGSWLICPDPFAGGPIQAGFAQGVTNDGTIAVGDPLGGGQMGDVTLSVTTGIITNTSTGALNINYGAGGARTVDTAVDNSGQFNVQTSADVNGAVTNLATGNLLICPQPLAPTTNVQFAAGVTNEGTLTLDDTAGQSVTLGSPPTYPVVNTSTGQLTVGYGAGGLRTIDADVENSGQLKVETSAVFTGAVQNMPGSELLICPNPLAAAPIEVDVSGSMTNQGTVTLESTNPADVVLNAQIDGQPEADGFVIANGGLLSGVGTIQGNLLNSGSIQPGMSVGQLAVTGNFTQDAGGTLTVQASSATPGTGYDQLVVGGDVSVAGVVELAFLNGFEPQRGDRFEIITNAATLGGEFTGEFLPELPVGMVWNIDYGASDVALVVTGAGDGNGDGVVDGLDYLLWASHYGDDPAADPPGSPANGDYDGDGVVGGLDYLVWAANFGAGASTAVPEPSSLLMFSIGGLALSARRRRD